jgi:hypothetical protein
MTAFRWAAAVAASIQYERPARRYRYRISILQAEFFLTQVLDRPVTGRVFFEKVIRENLDIVRPSQVQLIFDHRASTGVPPADSGHARLPPGWRPPCMSITRAPGSSFALAGTMPKPTRLATLRLGVVSAVVVLQHGA